jgi:hypothetical protein
VTELVQEPVAYACMKFSWKREGRMLKAAGLPTAANVGMVMSLRAFLYLFPGNVIT